MKKTLLISSCVVILSLVIVGYIKRDSIKTRVNHWRAASLLTESIEAGEKENWEEAEQIVIAAFQLKANDIGILRQWFTVAKEKDSQNLLVLAHALFKHPEANAKDRKQVIGLFFGLGDRVTFARLISKLPEEEQEHADILELQARFLLETGQPAAAINCIQNLKQKREKPADTLLLASALAGAPSDDNRTQIESQEIIDQLFQPDKDHQLALSSYFLLRQIPTELWQLETFSDAHKRLEGIAETTPIPTAISLLDIDRQILQEPDKRDEKIDAAVRQFAKTDPTVLGSWLLDHQLPDPVLTSIATLEKARESVKFFSLRVHGLLQKKEWESAEKLLTSPHPDADKTTTLAFLGMVAAQRGDEESSKQLWEEALTQAKEAPGKNTLLRLARLAGQGNEDIRNQAATEALKRPSAIPTPLPDVTFVLAHLVKSDSFEDLLGVHLNLYRSEPENPILLNNTAWLALVGGIFDKNQMLPKLEKMLEDHPNVPQIRSTLTLAYLTLDEVDKAHASAQALIELEAKKSSELAVLALLLAKQGDKLGAIAYLKEINWREMMTRERLFFRQTLKDEGIRGEIPLTLSW